MQRRPWPSTPSSRIPRGPPPRYARPQRGGLPRLLLELLLIVLIVAAYGVGLLHGRCQVLQPARVTFAELEERNPRLRQQYDSWRAARIAQGETPWEWSAFRTHLLALGALDPGPRPPADFVGALTLPFLGRLPLRLCPGPA